MDKLTQLAKEYKRKENPEICKQIFKLLEKVITKKANYVFYQQKFIKDKTITKEMEMFDKKTKQFIKKQIPICFRLYEVHKIELEDVIQELNLTILKLLENYDTNRPFTNYLFYKLKRWRPLCVQDTNFLGELNTKSESELSDNEEQQITMNNIKPTNFEEPIELDDLFQNLTEQEKKVIKLKAGNPQIKQSEIAKNIGVTQKTISIILANLKKKCKFKV